jgi:hypothetical protein
MPKRSCPEAEVEASALQYEDEDGRVEVFPPCGLPEAEEERIELALCARSADLFAETGLYVPYWMRQPVRPSHPSLTRS